MVLSCTTCLIVFQSSMQLWKCTDNSYTSKPKLENSSLLNRLFFFLSSRILTDQSHVAGGHVIWKSCRLYFASSFLSLHLCNKWYPKLSCSLRFLFVHLEWGSYVATELMVFWTLVSTHLVNLATTRNFFSTDENPEYGDKWRCNRIYIEFLCASPKAIISAGVRHFCLIAILPGRHLSVLWYTSPHRKYRGLLTSG